MDFVFASCIGDNGIECDGKLNLLQLFVQLEYFFTVSLQ